MQKKDGTKVHQEGKVTTQSHWSYQNPKKETKLSVYQTIKRSSAEIEECYVRARK